MPAPRIARETPDQPDVAALLQQADARSSALYPAESRHGAGLAALLHPTVRFFVARSGGAATGCGAYQVGADGAAELKRIFVTPAARGAGLGRAILHALEASAQREGVRWLRLETGVKSVEALRLYASLGYNRREPFPPYGPDPLSVFMEKRLAG